MDWWWDRFDAVIREWVRNDDESRETWNRAAPVNDYGALQAMANRGQIAADSSSRNAVWEALNYQRCHLDAFKAVLRDPLAEYAARPGDRSIGVVDVGCGAATVAFAFGETFHADTTTHYVGQDHHKPSRKLCRAMLTDGVTSGRGTAVVKADLADAFDHAINDLPKVERLFVTTSYLLCQDSMDRAGVLAIATQVERLVVARGRVRLVISDAPWSRSLVPVLIDALQRSTVVNVDRNTGDAYQYTMLFPDMTGRSWRQVRPGRDVDGHYLILSRL